MQDTVSPAISKLPYRIYCYWYQKSGYNVGSGAFVAKFTSPDYVGIMRTSRFETISNHRYPEGLRINLEIKAARENYKSLDTRHCATCKARFLCLTWK
jgi:hypothetical protein